MIKIEEYVLTVARIYVPTDRKVRRPLLLHVCASRSPEQGRQKERQRRSCLVSSVTRIALAMTRTTNTPSQVTASATRMKIPR